MIERSTSANVLIAIFIWTAADVGSRIGQEIDSVLNLNRERMRGRGIILLVIGLFPASCMGQQTIVGSVLDKSGKPLAGIEVWGDSLSQKIDPAHPHVYAVTDASGRFSIVNPGATLRTYDWKHRPSRVVLTPETRNVELVVEPAETDAVRVPFCEDSRFATRANRKRSRGLFWSFLLPPHAKIKSVSDADYVVDSIYFRDSSEQLHFAEGPIYGGYEAPAEWLVGAQEFTERAILEPQGGVAGVDVSGTLRTGERFRSFGLGTEQITYKTRAPEAVAFFDAFIATACMPRLASK